MKISMIILLTIMIFPFCFGEEIIVDSTAIQPKITFLELGSKTCIPCRQMEKVLESIETKYGDQIEVIFHDVKKDRDTAIKYKIKMIPTQVFLDEEGKEIHRNVGFYPEQKIDEFLQKQGLVIIPKENDDHK
ncbi:MAG: thioredoxin family protein [Candidatus Cloacimonetes bacterium]|nr:thioredoxin family protein [Candidatus Cloacimonadota bacterium]